jgi:hypothetical protein
VLIGIRAAVHRRLTAIADRLVLVVEHVRSIGRASASSNSVPAKHEPRSISRVQRARGEVEPPQRAGANARDLADEPIPVRLPWTAIEVERERALDAPLPLLEQDQADLLLVVASACRSASSSSRNAASGHHDAPQLARSAAASRRQAGARPAVA